MAKVPFTKLKCKINTSEIPVKIGDEIIAVKQYLPIQEKLALIGRVMEQAHEQDTMFANPVKAEVFSLLEIVFAYTNIAFTDKQKEDLPKLYDMLCGTGVNETEYSVLDIILQSIPETELTTIANGVADTIEAYYKYQNSVLGILDSINNDSSVLGQNLNNIREQLTDPKVMENVNNILAASALQ